MMAENKRFTLKHYEDTDWACDNGKSIYTKEMVELLNEQDETIQELKSEIEELENKIEVLEGKLWNCQNVR